MVLSPIGYFPMSSARVTTCIFLFLNVINGATELLRLARPQGGEIGSF